MKLRGIATYAGILCLCSSCAYKMVKVTQSNGKQIKERQYSDFYKEEEYNNRLTLNNNRHNFIVYKRVYGDQTYSLFTGKIHSGTVPNKVFVQYDSAARIYIEDTNKQYEPLFTSGLLYPKIIFCCFGNLCKPFRNYTDTIINDTSKSTKAKYGEPTLMGLLYIDSSSRKNNIRDTEWEFHYSVPEHIDDYAFKGISLHVNTIKELKGVESRHTKVFWLTFSVHSNYGYITTYTDYTFSLEVKNLNSTKKKNLKDFVSGAKVTSLYFDRMTFEN